MCGVVKWRPFNNSAKFSADIMQWCAPLLRQHAGRRDSAVPLSARSAANKGRANIANNRLERNLRKLEVILIVLRMGTGILKSQFGQ